MECYTGQYFPIFSMYSLLLHFFNYIPAVFFKCIDNYETVNLNKNIFNK